MEGLSLADELEKLAGLRDRGILTEEEFADQKRLLLATPAESAGGAGRASDYAAPLPVPLPSASTTPAGAWLTIAAGILLGVGTILPWGTATTGLGGVTRNGFQLGNNYSLTIDGPIVLMLGVITLVIGITRLTGNTMPSFIQRSSIITGLGAAFVVGSNYSGLHDWAQSINANQYLSAAIGYGFWICSVGVLLSIVGGFVLRSRASQ